MRAWLGLIASTALIGSFAAAQVPPAPKDAQTRTETTGDIPAKFTPPSGVKDYDKREMMVPMRDGTKLYTVIVVPKGAVNAPIVLTRTPYNAKARANRSDSASMLNTLPLADEIFVKAGYIRVYQDIRGKYGSEGDYVVTRPVIGPLNPTKVDHTTDAYDTIDWLVNKANLPESNGRVGMIGSSYEGFTVVMALLHPHPALKVAAPESPMVDGWMGDDWFHYGAFRLANIAWLGAQTGYKGEGKAPSTGGWDDYDNFREIGSAGAWAKKSGYDQLPYWQRMTQHPAYDGFWQGQDLVRLLEQNPSNVPTLWEQGLWDQEDMWGAIHSWEALKARGKLGNNWLVMGPWRHSQVNREGRSLGVFQWNGDTAAQFRQDMVLPLFNQYLKDGPPVQLPAAAIYNTGENHWDRFANWPLACETGCPAGLTPLYLQADGGAGFAKSAAGGDSYVSDPAKPVPHLSRPVNFDDGRWGEWLVQDQRFADGRPDVMTYQTPVLTKSVRVAGPPMADLWAKTTGTDGDFVVKVIDVYPTENAADPKMGGYQLPISLDIFRGRYRKDPAHPSAIPAGQVQEYKFRLPTVNHVFQPGHRIMVQVQSTLFPVYDRNPQRYVPNIFTAKPSDYQKATVTLVRGGATPSAVLLPVVTQYEYRISDRALHLAALVAVASMILFLCCRVGVLPAASAGDDIWYDDSAWWLLHEGVLRRHIHDNALGDAVRDFLPPMSALFTAASFRLFGPTQFAVGIVPTVCATTGMAMLATALRLRLRLSWPLAAGLATVPFYAPDLVKVAGHNRFEAKVFLFIAAGLLLGSLRPSTRVRQGMALGAAGLAAGGAVAAHYPVAPFSWGLVALWACWRPRPVAALLPFAAGTALAGLLGLAWIGADLPLFWQQMTASGARYSHSLSRLPPVIVLYAVVTLSCLATARRHDWARLFAIVALLALPAMLWWVTTAFYAAIAVALALAITLAEPVRRVGVRVLTLALFTTVSVVAVGASATASRHRSERDYTAFTRNLRAVLPAGDGGLVLIDRSAHLALLPCYRAGQLHHMIASDAATMPSRILLDSGAVGRVEAVVLDDATAADHARALPLYRAFMAGPHRAVRVSAVGIGVAGEPPYAMTVLLPPNDRGPRRATRC